MTKQQQITNRLDAICGEVEQQLRLPDSVDKYAALTKLHEDEANCWRELTESSRNRLSWLASMAAGERARTLAEHLASRAHGELLRPGQEVAA